MSLTFQWVAASTVEAPRTAGTLSNRVLRLRIRARESGAGAAAPGVLSGSYDEVAERISEYVDLGVDHFLFETDEPELERGHFARGVVPALERRGLLTRETPDDVVSLGVPVAF